VTRSVRPRVPAESHAGSDLTILGAIDASGRYPVSIAWSVRNWCPVACKTFPSARRLAREARLLAQLHHPNIVRFLGTAKPHHLLTEFLEGPLLGDLVRGHPRRRLGVSDAMRVGVHLGAALAHIHEQGFVHLDVKPWNAVVVRGRPVLIDLGSARRPGRLDRPVGTRPYMAPEQCRAGRVSAATDIYGLGITIYETLTGTLPFPRARRGAPLPQLVSVPVPARRRVPGIPATLDALLASCLAADPRDRPGLETLLPALNGFIRGGPSMWPASIHPA